MKRTRKILSLLMALVMALSLVPTTAVTAMAVFSGDVVQMGDSTYATIAAALTAAGTTKSTIQLRCDVTEDVTVASGQNITLDLNGYVLKAASAGSVITNNGTLTITDSDTSATHYFTDSKCAHGIAIGEACAFCGVCEHDVSVEYWCETCHTYVKPNNATEASKIAKKDGIFETLYTGSGTPEGTLGTDYIAVTGGCITGGTGTNSTIDSNCYCGGGVYSTGTLTLGSGNIIGNFGTGYGGGGVYIHTGSFTMTGGSITGNVAKAYSNYTPEILNDNIIITGGEGGGVFLQSGIYTMSGGTVSGNYASSGGGVSIRRLSGSDETAFEMTGGTISGNNARSGGGVANSNTMTVSGTASITGNHALDGEGGGIVNYDTLSVSGGSITGNTAATNGGGIYNYDTLSMSGGSVTGNIAATNGGGLYTYQSVTLGGTVQITGNTAEAAGNNFMTFVMNPTTSTDGKIILGTSTNGTDGNGVLKPANGMSVGVAAQTYDTVLQEEVFLEGAFTTTATEADVQYFTSDNTDYTVKFVTDHLELASGAKTNISSTVPAEENIKQNGEQVADDNNILTKLTGNTQVGKKASHIEDKISGATELKVELKSIDFATSGKTTVKTATFDVKAMNGTDPVASYSAENVTFRLPVYAEDGDGYKSAKVFNGTTELEAVEIEGSGENQYIEVTAPTFTSTASEYSYELSTVDIASAGDTVFAAALELNENLNMNLYIKLDGASVTEDATEAAKYTVKGTFDGETVTRTAFTYVDEKGYRAANIAEIYSYQMSQDVTISVYYGTGDNTVLLKTVDYSVQDYFKAMLDICTAEAGDTVGTLNKTSLAAFCKAALNYGTEAQKYFSGKSYKSGSGTKSYDVNLTNLANSVLEDGDKTVSATKPDGSVSRSGSVAGITKYKLNVVLGSETAMKLYLYGDVTGVTVECSPTMTVGDIVAEGSGVYSCKISGIKAAELDTEYDITVTKGSETATIRFSPFIYAAAKWDDADLGSLCKALVNYGTAADTLFTHPS